MARDRVHWGDWVAARAHAVGFRRQRDLAKAVGCTEDRVSAWVQLETPPKQMRRGYDKALAHALQVTPEILFDDFENTRPEQLHPNGHTSIRTLPWNKPERWSKMTPHDRWQTIGALLDYTEREVLMDFLRAGIELRVRQTERNLKSFEDSLKLPAAMPGRKNAPPRG